MGVTALLGSNKKMTSDYKLVGSLTKRSRCAVSDFPIQTLLTNFNWL